MRARAETVRALRDAIRSGKYEVDLDLERAAFNVDDDDSDLFSAAALLGRIEEPCLDLYGVPARIEDLASGVRARTPEERGWP